VIAGNAAGQNVAPPLHLSCLKMSKFEFSDITGFTSQLLPDRDFATYRDSSFIALDGVLKTDQLRILKTPPHSPLCNAYAERHVREIRQTLDNLILLGERHLRRALLAIEAHHNARRPHQGIANVIPLGFDYPAEPALPAEVECEQDLGGLLNHYSLKKAA